METAYTPDSVAEMLADAYEARYGWDAEHSRAGFIRNQRRALQDAAVPEDFAADVLDEVLDEIEEGRAEPFRLALHGERAGYNDRYTGGTYEEDFIRLLYHEREIDYRPGNLGESPVSVAGCYDTRFGGRYVHEYGHHWTQKVRPRALRRAQGVIDDNYDLLKDGLSTYSVTNASELAAESYTAFQHPNFGNLSGPVRSVVEYILFGS